MIIRRQQKASWALKGRGDFLGEDRADWCWSHGGGAIMTKIELVDAYVRGDLDRRRFISKLTAMGVSGGAAIAYAGSLAQNAAASPSRNGAGFIARAQDADDEYGTAIIIENIIAILEELLADINDIFDSFDDFLNQFDVGDFVDGGLDESDFDVIEDARAQIAEQIDALIATLEAIFGTTRSSSTIKAFRSSRVSSLGQTSGTVLEQLTVLAEKLNRQVGVYAAVIPAVEDGEQRQLMTNIGLVTARHAALVSHMAGLNPIPSAFEVPIDPMS